MADQSNPASGPQPTEEISVIRLGAAIPVALAFE
jgi:hypothetical protein